MVTISKNMFDKYKMHWFYVSLFSFKEIIMAFDLFVKVLIFFHEINGWIKFRMTSKKSNTSRIISNFID